MSRVRRCGRVAYVVLSVSMVAACTATDGPSAAFVVSAEPVWTAPTGLFAGRFPDLRGDSLVVYGASEDTDDNRAVTVLDVATGKTRWSADSQDSTESGRVRQEKVADVGDGDWVVLAPYECGTAPGCAAGNGLAALDGNDGRTRWRTPLDPRLPVKYIAVGGDVAVSLLSASDDTLAGSRAVATDVSDGTVRWESAGMWPVFVAGDTVLGIEADRLVPLDPTVTQAATVVALDARTGARRWDLADRYPRSNLQLALGDVAVIGTADEDGGNQRSRIIDAGTGQELADLGEPLRCLDDQESLVACGTEEGRDLTLFDVARREKSVLRDAIRRDGEEVLSPVRGYLFRGEDVIDRTGTVVSDQPLGLVVAMSDRYLVSFLDRSGGAGDDVLAGYRIEKNE